MLTRVGQGVLVHQSELLQNNTAVVQGRAGVALAHRSRRQVRARIELDRAYVQTLHAGGGVDDPRIGPSAKPGWE